MKNRDELLKARQERISNIFDSFNNDLEKGKKAEIGEEREWNGQKYKKVGEGQWVPVTEGGKSEKKEGDPKDAEAKKEEGGSESSSEKQESSSAESDKYVKEQMAETKKHLEAVAKYNTPESLMQNVSEERKTRIVNNIVGAFAVKMGMPESAAKETSFADMPGMKDPETFESAANALKEAIHKEYGSPEQQIKTAIQEKKNRETEKKMISDANESMKKENAQKIEEMLEFDPNTTNEQIADELGISEEEVATYFDDDDNVIVPEGDFEMDQKNKPVENKWGDYAIGNDKPQSAQQKLDSHAEKINNTIKANEAELRAFAEANGHTGKYTKFEDLGQYGFRSIANDPKFAAEHPELASQMKDQFEKNVGLIDSANREKATQFMQEKAPDAAQALKEAGLSVAKIEDRGRNNFTVEIDHAEAGATGGEAADDAIAEKVKAAFGGFKANRGYRGHSGRSISIDFNGKTKLKKSHEDEIQDHINSRINNITKGFE